MSRRVLLRASLLLLLAGSATGCTYYRAITPPPPGKQAHLDTAKDELRISEGVAVAFECVDGSGGPCEPRNAATDDPEIAEVHPAHANELRPDGMQGHHGPASGSLPPSAYVVVGMSPGETTLRVGDEDPLRVIVEQ